MHLALRRKLLPLALCVLPLALAPVVKGATANISPTQYLDDIQYLASAQMRGRATGSPELEKAAHYIAKRFHEFGLLPIDRKSYLQAFSVTTNARLGNGNRFAYSEDGKTTELRFREDFIPFNFSSRGKVTGDVVFAGYGITAPEYDYDDYAGIDVKDKIVVVLRHEPQEFDEKSIFHGKVYTQHAQFFSKATNARMHGAKGVILINDLAAHQGASDELEKFGATAGPADCGIPFLQVKAATAERWFAAVDKNLSEIQAAIDKDLKPRSFAFPPSLQIRANLDVERVVKKVHNVAGYLPGLTNEYVIIGAHYDHLGLGEQFSMAPSMIGTVHPGADDNASGTAGVIELARWFSIQPKQKRGILFLAFAGEEIGLLGSSYYVSHPDFPLHNAVAMINLDMIGRIRQDRVYIGGAASGTNLRSMLDGISPKYHMSVDYSDTTGYGSSDHASFLAKQVPVLFFFSGLHADYHTPGDTWQKIDAPDAARLLQMIADVTDNLRETAHRPLFVQVREPESHAGVAGSSSAGNGYGPYFGSVPDFAETGQGVRFADIREDSPAAKAGIRAGDVLVEFDGKPVQNLYDFTYVLRSKHPGDIVSVKVVRDHATLEMEVLLTKRN